MEKGISETKEETLQMHAENHCPRMSTGRGTGRVCDGMDTRQDMEFAHGSKTTLPCRVEESKGDLKTVENGTETSTNETEALID